MAWVYGGVGESLGIETLETTQEETPNYEQAIRFPNLSSIAAARFAHNHPEKVKAYWHTLEPLIRSYFSRKQRSWFGSLTRRPFQVPKVDQVFPQFSKISGQQNPIAPRKFKEINPFFGDSSDRVSLIKRTRDRPERE